MKPTVEQIGNLLALKRDERPEEGYWQDFLCEFHQGQRERAVMKSGLKGFLERTSAWFSDVGPSKWAYGAGLAYAALMIGFILTPREVAKDTAPVTPVNYQVVPQSVSPQVEQLNQLDLSPSTQGSAGEQVF